ncbi:MAG TPA: VWA domain-containing protein, partial [Actinomycetota bacterium]|nr:VWA domain-containing protein [Actinomycetota bacterium]
MVANPPEPGALERLIGFGRDLRLRGLPVGTGRIVTFCRAAGALVLLERDDLYWAGRSSLISRPEDVEAFDEAFAAWFGTGLRLELPTPGPPPDLEGLDEHERALEGDELDDRVIAREWHELEEDALTEGEASIRIVASAAEMLREKSFGDLTEEERLRVTHLIRKLAVQLPMQHTRRYRAAGSGARFDVRRTLRRSLRTQGEPFHRAWRDRGRRTRPLVLILDISGSMAPYSRAL